MKSGLFSVIPEKAKGRDSAARVRQLVPETIKDLDKNSLLKVYGRVFDYFYCNVILSMRNRKRNFNSHIIENRFEQSPGLLGV